MKIKTWIKSPVGAGVSLSTCLFVFFIVGIRMFNDHQSISVARAMRDSDNQPVQGNVRYTTQEMLGTLTSETDNLNKELAEIKSQFDDVKTSQKDKQTLQQQMEHLKAQNTKLQQQMNEALSKINDNKSNDKHKQPEPLTPANKGGASQASPNQSTPGKKLVISLSDVKTPLSPKGKQDNPFDHQPGSLLHPNEQKAPFSPKKSADDKVIPMYTIPQNTWLTGAIAEQPLIGIVPVNGQVTNPRSVSFAVQSKNLAANGWQLPSVLKGIQGDALCQGFFAVKRPAVTCQVTSLTFIFNDGRINTVNASKEGNLGIVTDKYGNPQISGILHSNLGYFLAGTTVFAGAQGYGNALSAAQVQTSSSDGLVPSISSIVGNANTYAEGQGLSSAAKAAQAWWVDRMKSTFDYVEVPNWNADTHALLQLNIKITQAIQLDYNTQARKVDYDNEINDQNSHSLD